MFKLKTAFASYFSKEKKGTLCNTFSIAIGIRLLRNAAETYYKFSVLAYYSLNLKDFVRDLFALVKVNTFTISEGSHVSLINAKEHMLKRISGGVSNNSYTCQGDTSILFRKEGNKAATEFSKINNHQLAIFVPRK